MPRKLKLKKLEKKLKRLVVPRKHYRMHNLRKQKEIERKRSEQEKALLSAEKEAKKEAAMREHELKMADLGKHPTSDRSSAFNPARNIRLVSPFQEKELDKYFAHFEKVADSLNWPKESWVLLLQNVLVGKAQ